MKTASVGWIKLKNTEAYEDCISWLNQQSSTTNYAVTSLDIKQIKIKNDIIEWIQKSNTNRKLHTLYSYLVY